MYGYIFLNDSSPQVMDYHRWSERVLWQITDALQSAHVACSLPDKSPLRAPVWLSALVTEGTGRLCMLFISLALQHCSCHYHNLIPIDSELSCKSFNDSQCVGSISVILPSPLGLTFYNVYFNLQEPRGCFNFCNMHSSSEAHHTQTVRSLHTCCLGPFMLKVSCREDNMVH